MMSLTPFIQNVQTSGAKKRGEVYAGDNSTTWYPSLWEHINLQFLNSQVPQKKSARIDNLSPNLGTRPNILHIDQMSLFVHLQIGKVVDFRGDNNCELEAVVKHLGKGEDNYGLIRIAMIRKLNPHKSDYL